MRGAFDSEFGRSNLGRAVVRERLRREEVCGGLQTIRAQRGSEANAHLSKFAATRRQLQIQDAPASEQKQLLAAGLVM